MRRGHWLLVTVLVVCTLVAACSYGGLPARDDRVITSGLGVFTFDGYPPLKDRPVRVWYAAPPDPSTAQILIVMHGVERDAEEYRADWRDQVDAHNVLVLVPEFSNEHYPGTDAYNLGNMTDENGNLQPREEWSFNVIEALFDHVVQELDSSAKDYALFGHSAGAQFVHRFVEFMPANRARVAVAANAGWYTVPDDNVKFPYGLRGAPAEPDRLEHAFASNLTILLGADDTDTESESLRRDDDADAQGTNRLDRGWNFYRTAQERAQRESLTFDWHLMVAPGIAHSHNNMAAVAAPLLLKAAN